MWRGHELFVSSLPLLVEYIPATLFYFLTPTVISLVLGALICRVRVGKKNPLYWLVCIIAEQILKRINKKMNRYQKTVSAV